MKNRLFVVAGVIAIIGTAWYLGRMKTTSAPIVAAASTPTQVETTIAEPAKLAMTITGPLEENLDLSRAFNPTREEEVSPLILASFITPEIKPAPIPASRYRSMLLGIDALNPTGLRLGWLSVDLPATDVLDIMPREVGK